MVMGVSGSGGEDGAQDGRGPTQNPASRAGGRRGGGETAGVGEADGGGRVWGPGVSGSSAPGWRGSPTGLPSCPSTAGRGPSSRCRWRAVRLLLQGQGLHALPAAGEALRPGAHPGQRLRRPCESARGQGGCGRAALAGVNVRLLPCCLTVPSRAGVGGGGGDRAPAARTWAPSLPPTVFAIVSGRGHPRGPSALPGVRPRPSPSKQQGVSVGGVRVLRPHLGRAQWRPPAAAVAPAPHVRLIQRDSDSWIRRLTAGPQAGWVTQDCRRGPGPGVLGRGSSARGS